jgi:hypothetical protein
MTSTINTFSNRINTGFPEAGKNNNSQGFRSNFTAIQNALVTAANEISDLQVNGVNLNKPINDLGFTSTLSRAQLKNSGLTTYTASSSTNIAGYIEIDYTQGSYQEVTVSATATTFLVKNWPTVSNVYGNVRLVVNNLSTGTIGFVADMGGSLYNADPLPYSTTATTPNITVWEIWSSDSGNRVFVDFIKGPYV